MGFALGEGCSSACVSAAKQPSLILLSLSPRSARAAGVLVLTDRRVNVKWYPAGKTPRGCPVKAAEPSRRVGLDGGEKRFCGVLLYCSYYFISSLQNQLVTTPFTYRPFRRSKTPHSLWVQSKGL